MSNSNNASQREQQVDTASLIAAFRSLDRRLREEQGRPPWELTYEEYVRRFPWTVGAPQQEALLPQSSPRDHFESLLPRGISEDNPYREAYLQSLVLINSFNLFRRRVGLVLGQSREAYPVTNEDIAIEERFIDGANRAMFNAYFWEIEGSPRRDDALRTIDDVDTWGNWIRDIQRLIVDDALGIPPDTPLPDAAGYYAIRMPDFLQRFIPEPHRDATPHQLQIQTRAQTKGAVSVPFDGFARYEENPLNFTQAQQQGHNSLPQQAMAQVVGPANPGNQNVLPIAQQRDQATLLAETVPQATDWRWAAGWEGGGRKKKKRKTKRKANKRRKTKKHR